MKLGEEIDNLIAKIPWLNGKPRIQRLGKFVLSAFLIYMVCKAPIMLVLTEMAGVHYVFSGFIAGAVMTLLNFLPSEWWVWKNRSEELPKTSNDEE